jgi:hypothetical protein
MSWTKQYQSFVSNLQKLSKVTVKYNLYLNSSKYVLKVNMNYCTKLQIIWTFWDKGKIVGNKSAKERFYLLYWKNFKWVNCTVNGEFHPQWGSEEGWQVLYK